MNDAELKILAERITKALKPAIEAIAELSALKRIGYQPTGPNRPITRREFETLMRRGFAFQPNGDDPRSTIFVEQ